MHNNVLAQGDATQQQVRSGTYTPTLTAVANVTSTTSHQAQWMRVGNVVTVTGQLVITPTSNNTETKIGISLPVASNFVTGYECAGVANTKNNTIAENTGSVYADATNDRAELDYFETHGTANTFTYTFSYEVL